MRWQHADFDQHVPPCLSGLIVTTPEVAFVVVEMHARRGARVVEQAARGIGLLARCGLSRLEPDEQTWKGSFDFDSRWRKGRSRHGACKRACTHAPTGSSPPASQYA